MATCYLMVWLEWDPSMGDEPRFAGAGFYSEPPWGITHEQRKSLPAIVSEVEAPTFGEAWEKMRENCEHQVEWYAQQGFDTLRAKVMRAALGGAK